MSRFANRKFSRLADTVRRAALGGARGERLGDLDQLAVFHAHGAGMHAVGAAALRVIHQRVGAVNQFGGKLPRDSAALGDRPESQADDADVDADGASRETAIVASPVMPFDGRLEAI